MRIIHEGRVENAVRATLQTWLSTFLADVEREDGLAVGTVERPREWVRTTDALAIPKHQLPTVAIVGDGWLSEPDWDDELGGAVWWQVTIAVFAKGVDRDDSLDNSRRIAAAIRQTLRSKPALGGFADGIWLIDAGSDLVDGAMERTLSGAVCTVGVLVPATHDSGLGPAQPDPEETYPDHPDAPEPLTVNTTVTRLD